MRILCAVLTILLLLSATACSADDTAGGTLTAIAGDDLGNVYQELAEFPGNVLVPTAVTPEQIAGGDATGWEYLWQEEAAPRVELRTYENGALSGTVSVLPGSAGISGTILFSAADSDSGYVWSTDLDDGNGLQSHRYTYETDSRSEPRRLAAGTTALEPGEEIWLAALLYGLGDDDKPTDITALQAQGLGSVPLAAVLSVTFESSASES